MDINFDEFRRINGGGEMSRYYESKVRTNRLYCSDCNKAIKRGDDVIFELEDGRMLNVYGECCKENYMQSALEDEEHPYSSEALGQD